MHDLGFFMCLCIVGFAAYCMAGFLDARKRQLRRAFVDSRNPQSDGVFEAGVSALNPVPAGFAREFRQTVARVLGVDAARLDPQDRLIYDLRVFGFDAMELAAALERAFDVRVRVVDVMRAGTLRKLAMLINERGQEISEFEPPLHREPVPKVPPPAPAKDDGPVAPPPIPQ